MQRLIPAAILSAFVFGIISSFSIIDSSISLSEFGIYLLNGLFFDTVHALGNVVIGLWLAPWFTRFLHNEEFKVTSPLEIHAIVEG